LCALLAAEANDDRPKIPHAMKRSPCERLYCSFAVPFVFGFPIRLLDEEVDPAERNANISSLLQFVLAIACRLLLLLLLLLCKTADEVCVPISRRFDDNFLAFIVEISFRLLLLLLMLIISNFIAQTAEVEHEGVVASFQYRMKLTNNRNQL